jgi:hypothetical protein
MAFTDSFFNYGEIFRSINAFLFMLLSLGLLIRTSTLMKLRKIEKLMERNAELENLVGQIDPNASEKKASQAVLY